VVVVPTDREPLVEDWSQRTNLDGREYLLQFTWSRREERWYLSVADAAGAPIVSGVKLCAGWPVALRVSDPRCFPGELLVLDLSASGSAGLDLARASDPGLDDLGQRVVVLYMTPADLLSG
jgi:uncharacterized protein DUF6983